MPGFNSGAVAVTVQLGRGPSGVSNGTVAGSDGVFEGQYGLIADFVTLPIVPASVSGIYAPPLPFVDTFTGTDGTPWESPKWITNDIGTGSVQISTNTGRMQTTVGAYADYVQAVSNHEPTADCEVTGNVNIPAAETYIVIALRGDGGFGGGDPTTPYNGLRFNIEPSGNTLEIGDSINGVYTLRATTTLAGLSAGGAFKFRARAVGANLSFRVWSAAGGEPGTWNLTYASETMLSPGVLQLAFQCGSVVSTRNVDWDNINLAMAAAWVTATAKRWNGTAWVTATVKRWNGSAWVTATAGRY